MQSINILLSLRNAVLTRGKERKTAAVLREKITIPLDNGARFPINYVKGKIEKSVDRKRVRATASSQERVGHRLKANPDKPAPKCLPKAAADKAPGITGRVSADAAAALRLLSGRERLFSPNKVEPRCAFVFMMGARILLSKRSIRTKHSNEAFERGIRTRHSLERQTLCSKR